MDRHRAADDLARDGMALLWHYIVSRSVNENGEDIEEGTLEEIERYEAECYQSLREIADEWMRAYIREDTNCGLPDSARN